MATSSAMSTSNQFVKYTITITQNSQSIANNTSNVTVSVRFYRTNTGYETYGNGTVYCKIDGTTYSASVTPSQGITNSGIVLFTKTLDISHNSDGSKTLTCSAWISHNAPLTSSEQNYSQALTTIPRKSTLSVANGTLGSAHTLTVTRQSSSFTHTIKYECGDYNGYICEKSSTTSISWTPPLEFSNGAPSSTSVHISFSIETFNGATSLGLNHYSIISDIPSTVIPTVSFNVSDEMGYDSTYGDYVQSRSKFKIEITASGIYNSIIKSYKTTVDGSTFAASSFTTELIKNSGTLTINVSVTDSRGRSATVSKTVTVLAYSSPKLTGFTVKRSDSNGGSTSSGAYLTVIFNSSITSLSSKNTATYNIKYKKKSDSTYTTATLSSYSNNYAVSNGTYTFAADKSSSYDVILEATDAFYTTTQSASGPTTSVLFSALRKGLGWAFGKVAEVENALEIAFDTYITKNLNVTGNTLISGNSTVTGTSTVENTAYFNANIYDQYNTRMMNGLAIHTGSGSDAVDPNTTIEHLILTDVNVPISGFAYVHTMFYSNKTNTSNRAQIAIPYSKADSIYHRYYYDGSWSAWKSSAYVGAQKVLWSGGHYMNEYQTATLSESISSQNNGIVLVFSAYDNEAQNYDFVTYFVPKYHVSAHNYSNVQVPLFGDNFWKNSD